MIIKLTISFLYSYYLSFNLTSLNIELCIQELIKFRCVAIDGAAYTTHEHGHAPID